MSEQDDVPYRLLSDAEVTNCNCGTLDRRPWLHKGWCNVYESKATAAPSELTPEEQQQAWEAQDHERRTRISDAMRQASGSVLSGDPLVVFLYLLARDALPLGSVAELVIAVEAHQDGADEALFTNGWLAQWAQYTANLLRDEQATPVGTVAERLAPQRANPSPEELL